MARERSLVTRVGKEFAEWLQSREEFYKKRGLSPSRPELTNEAAKLLKGSEWNKEKDGGNIF